MVRETARAYRGLLPDEQAKAVIFANHYGEAAAVNFYGPRYSLPTAISNNQNYCLGSQRAQPARLSSFSVAMERETGNIFEASKPQDRSPIHIPVRMSTLQFGCVV